MNRFFCIVVAIAAFSLFCGATVAQAKTEIQFWHAMEGTRGEILEELVKRFNESQGEFEVKATYKGTYPELQASALAAYRLKTAPHIVQIHEVGTRTMNLSGAVVPVYRLMQQEKIAVDWADLVETIFNYYAKDGKLNSLPFNVSTPVLYYNKDVFKKAGLEDKPPVTWGEVEAVSRKILATGAAKCGFATSWPSWTMFENTFAWHDQPFASNQNGFAGLGNKIFINSEFGLMHIGALVKWQKENIYSFGGKMSEADSKFIDAECAMLVQSSGSIGGFKKSLKFDWATGQLPHWGPPYTKANTILGGASLYVMRGRDPGDYKGVAQFMKFLTEPQQQIFWKEGTGYMPITKTALKSLQDSGFYKKNPEQWTGMSQLINAKPTPNSRGIRIGYYGRVREVILTELECIFNGKKTVKEGLDSAVVRGNAILREFGVTHKPWPGEI